MDENKEFLASENEEDTTVNSDTDTVNSEQPAELTDEYLSEFCEEIAETEADLQETPATSNSEAKTAVATKKKSFIQIPIIISAVLLVLVALGFLVFKCFFNTSIVGTWTVNSTATPDEATASEETATSYYTFEDDGTAKISLGTMRMEGTYSVSTTEEGTRSVEINIPSALQGTFEFEVSGNEFQGRKLVLTSSYYGQSIEFSSTNMEKPEMKVEEGFEPSEKLTGEWVYDDGYYKMKYDLREDGTATVNQSDVIFADGVYTYTDNKITIKYFTTSEVTMELEYQFDGEKLMLNGIPYSKSTDASADEA